MKLRASLLVLTASFITAAAFGQPVNNNVKLYQPDNNPLVTSDGKKIANPAAGSSFQVVYATAFNQGTEALKVLNTGAAGGVDGSGSICVNVYAFDNTATFQDCCYCKLSANSLGTIPLNGQFGGSATMVIKLIATYPNGYQPNVFSNTTTTNSAQPNGTTTNTCNAASPSTSLDPTNTDANHLSGISQGTGGLATNPAAPQYLAPGMAVWLDTTPFASANHPQLEAHQSALSMGEAGSLAYQCAAKHGGLGAATTSQCPAALCQ